MRAALVILAGLLCGAPAPERLAVLPVLLDADAVADVDEVFDAVRTAAHLRTGLRPMTVGEYYFHGGQELAKRSLACGPDPACIARELRPMDARLGLLVLVNGELEPPLVSLILLDAQQGEVVGEWAGRVAGGRGAVRATVVSRSSALLDAQGFLQSGRLRVRAQPAQAALMVDDAVPPDLGTADTFTLPPGPHRLVATAAGHAPRALEVQVRPAEVTDVDLALTPEASVLSSPWLWVGAGVLAAGVAASVAVVATRGQDAPPCACVLTRDQMSCGCPR